MSILTKNKDRISNRLYTNYRGEKKIIIPISKHNNVEFQGTYGHSHSANFIVDGHGRNAIEIVYKHSAPDSPNSTLERVLGFAFSKPIYPPIAAQWDIFQKRHRAKEIIESASANLLIYRYMVGFYAGRDSDIHCYVLGDGKQPRTAATLYEKVPWQIYSVDPIMDEKWMDMANERFHPKRDLAENIDFEGDLIILMSVHGHANVRRIFETLTQKGKHVIVLSMPCCNAGQQLLEEPPIVTSRVPTHHTERSSVIHMWDSARMGQTIDVIHS